MPHIRPGLFIRYKAYRHLHYIRPTISSLYNGHPFSYKTNLGPCCGLTWKRITWSLIWDKCGSHRLTKWSLLGLICGAIWYWNQFCYCRLAYHYFYKMYITYNKSSQIHCVHANIISPSDKHITTSQQTPSKSASAAIT